MDVPPSLDVVQKALSVLHKENDLLAKERASAWLEDLQKSVFAWEIADKLLQIHADEESYYFAAQTMRSKIKSSFVELLPDTRLALRDSILKHCTEIHNDTPSTIVTELCQALADLLIQMATWQNSLQELINQFSLKSEHWRFLVELLTVLPQELGEKEDEDDEDDKKSGHQLRVSSNRRMQMYQELVKAFPLILQLLTAIWNSSPTEVKTQLVILRCLISYLERQVIEPVSFLASKILDLPLSIMSNIANPQELLGVASDFLCGALDSIDLASNETYEHTVYGPVLKLVEPYKMTIPARNTELSGCYVRVFTTMGGAVLSGRLDSASQDFDHLHSAVKLLLMCADHPDFEVVSVTFMFWDKFIQILNNIDDQPQLNTLKPYMTQLINSLCRLCQLSTTQDGCKVNGRRSSHENRANVGAAPGQQAKMFLPAGRVRHECLHNFHLTDDNHNSFMIQTGVDVEDDFACFRNDSSVLVHEIARIIEPQNVILQMFELIEMNPESWSVLEVALLVMCGTANHLSFKEMKLAQRVVDCVLALPATIHIAVRYTSIKLVGNLSQCLRVNPIYISKCMTFLISGLSHRDLVTIASKCLNRLCFNCTNHMLGDYATIIQAIQTIDSPTTPMSKPVAANMLGAASVLLAGQSPVRLAQGIHHLCSQQVEQLNRVLASNDTTFDHDSINDPSVWLDRIAAIFQDIKAANGNEPNHPCKEVIYQMWPFLSRCLTKYETNAYVCERCCRVVRYAIRCIPVTSIVLLIPLKCQVVQTYQRHPYPCFLFLTSILVDEFGTNPIHVPLLIGMTQALLTPAFHILNEKGGLRNHPDTVEDIFLLCQRLIKTMPVAFICTEMSNPVMMCAIASLELEHRNAHSAVTQFLSMLIEVGLGNEMGTEVETGRRVVQELVILYGQGIVDKIIKSCVAGLTNSSLKNCAKILYELVHLNCQAGHGWIQATLVSLPTHFPGGAVNATAPQLNDFLLKVSSATSSQHLKQALRDLAELHL